VVILCAVVGQNQVIRVWNQVQSVLRESVHQGLDYLRKRHEGPLPDNGVRKLESVVV
jgi:hypothetical protein